MRRKSGNLEGHTPCLGTTNLLQRGRFLRLQESALSFYGNLASSRWALPNSPSGEIAPKRAKLLFHDLSFLLLKPFAVKPTGRKAFTLAVSFCSLMNPMSTLF